MIIVPIKDGENIDRALKKYKRIDVLINNEKSPLMVAVQRTTASLAKCYQGDLRKLLYPEINAVELEKPLPF